MAAAISIIENIIIHHVMAAKIIITGDFFFFSCGFGVAQSL